MLPSALVHAPTVDGAVRAAVAGLADELRGIDGALDPVADALVEAGAGGKRLRGALVCWSFLAHGGPAAADVLGAAVAVELVHLSALIHDDIIDRADTRRGRPSVHARFAAASGDEDHGRVVAILLGDAVLAAAPAPLETCSVDADALARARSALVRLQIEVMAGQYLDVDAVVRRDANPARALTIATLKSGRYSVARPLELGALLAGAPNADAERLVAVGDPIGVAFQLRDDLLGVFGDPDVTGKPAGADLVEGKRTLLVAETLARLPEVDRARLDAALGAAGTDAAEVTALTAMVEACGARAAIEARIVRLQDEAREAAAALGLDAGAATALDELAGWAATRHG